MFLPLIPGLPDDVVLNHILARVSWKYFFVLAAVNRRWREEFQSRRVFEHRRVAGSSEKLIALIHLSAPECQEYVLSVSSLSQANAWLRLPRIPGVRRGLPQCCRLVFLDGKLYILGGFDWAADADDDDDGLGSFANRERQIVPTSNVYELDIAAGCGGWKTGAAMSRPMVNFSCKVEDGKIHVTECVQDDVWDDVRRWETDVYDPVSKSWTAGASQMFPRLLPQPRLRECKGVFPDEVSWSFCFPNTAFARVNGRLYSVCSGGVSVWDGASAEWCRQSMSFWDRLRSDGANDIRCWTATPFDGELLVVVSWTVWLSSEMVFAIIMSRGLGSQDQCITWNQINFPDSLGWCRPRQSATLSQKATIDQLPEAFFNWFPLQVYPSTV